MSSPKPRKGSGPKLCPICRQTLKSPEIKNIVREELHDYGRRVLEAHRMRKERAYAEANQT